MSTTIQRLRVQVDADIDKARDGLDRLNDAGSRTPAWAGAAKAAVGAFVGAAVVGLGSKMVSAASDLNETLSKTGVVFGPQSDQVVGYAQEMADSFGLPKTAILDAASGFGLLGKAAGLTGSDLTGMSTNLTDLAADASSFYNVPLEQALADFGSALSGETEPVKKYGVLMNEAAVANEAVALGIAKAGDELTEGQKVQARASLIAKGLADASGDLARTQESVSNQTRELRGRVTNLAASMGQALLPAVGAVLGGLNGLIAALPSIVQRVKDWVADNAGLVAGLKVAAGVVAAFVGGLLAAMAVQKVVAIIQRIRLAVLLMNAALLANPIGLIVAALAALAAGVYLAYTRFEPFRAVVDSVGGYLKGLYDRVMESFAAWGGMERVLGIASAALSTIGGWLMTAWGYLGQFRDRVMEFITGADLGGAFSNIGTALQGFMPLFSQLGDLGQRIWGVLQQVWQIVMDNKAVFLALVGVIALVVAPIPVLIAALIAAYTQFEGFRNVVNGVVTFIVGTVVPALIGLVQTGIQFVITAVNWLMDAWNKVAPVVAGAIGTAAGAIGSFTSWLKGLWEQFWGTYEVPVRVAWEVIKGVVKAGTGIVLSVIRTVLATVGTVIKTGMAVAQQVFSVAWYVIGNVVSTAWNVVKALVSAGMGVIKNAVQLGMNLLTGNWRGAWDSLKGIFSSAWGGIRGAVTAAISGLISLMGGLPGRLKGALGNIGGLLTGAGRDLIEGLARGIRNAAGSATSAISGVMSRVRGFLPGSPIKYGPLRDWNRGGAGKRLTALLASGITAGEGDVAKAANRMARLAAVSLAGEARIGAVGGPGRAIRAARGPESVLAPTARVGAPAAGSTTFQFTTYNPVAEPTSVTTNRALARLGALDLA